MTLVFLSGSVAGGFAHRFYTLSSVKAESAPKEYRRKYIEEMTHRLALSSDQVHKVDAVLDATRARYRQVWERSKPEMDTINEKYKDGDVLKKQQATMDLYRKAGVNRRQCDSSSPITAWSISHQLWPASG